MAPCMKLDRWHITCEYVMLGVVPLCIIFTKEVGFTKLTTTGNKNVQQILFETIHSTAVQSYFKTKVSLKIHTILIGIKIRL